MSSVRDITILSAERTSLVPIMGAPKSARLVTFDWDGQVFTFSRYDDEDAWFADSLIGVNGAPIFVHGNGSRTCAKRRATDQVTDVLDRLDI